MIPFSPWHVWGATTLLSVLLFLGFWSLDARDQKRNGELMREIRGAKMLGSAAYGRYDETDAKVMDHERRITDLEQQRDTEGG